MHTNAIAFILYTICFWFAGACVLKYFFFMIQPEGALDLVFGWQNMLKKLYNGNKASQLLGKALGDCQMCTSFWFMPAWYGCYYLFCHWVLHHWVTDTIDTAGWYWTKVSLVNVIWYYVFHSIGAFTGLVTITKILTGKKK
jgi:hypothetical protein